MECAALDLVNSEVFDYLGHAPAQDRLDEPDWVAQFVARWGLTEAGPPDAAALAALRALRAILRRLVDRIAAGQDPAGPDLAHLNAALAAAPLYRRLTATDGGYRVDLVPVTRDWRWAVAAIAASFADLLVHHDPARLRTCENPDCRWAFYDGSRSRTRRWCEDTCGNLMKVRRFRARHSHAHPPATGQSSQSPDRPRQPAG